MQPPSLLLGAPNKSPTEGVGRVVSADPNRNCPYFKVRLAFEDFA